MEFFVKACLVEEDFTVATVIKGGKHLADNFQQYGSHHLSPKPYFTFKITQWSTRFQTCEVLLN
jgi:hypothetical protein